MSEDAGEPGMAKEQIALPDGRYLIYYTFPGDKAEAGAADGGERERGDGSEAS